MIAAITASIVAILGAVTTLIVQIRHSSNPDAHSNAVQKKG